MPVLMVATYNEDGSVNVMNAAWGTMQERGTVALNLCLMEFEVVRFNELKRYLKEISDRTLSMNLKELEADRLIVRKGGLCRNVAR